MRKNNRKGFTIVELVIVIAVIAILAAVLIPTFGGVISKAQESAALQKASALYKEAYAVAISDGKIVATEKTPEVTNDKGEVTTPAEMYEGEVVEAGDLKFVFISADGAIDNVTVKVYNKTTIITYESEKWTDENGAIDGYNVRVANGVVSVSKP